MKTGVGARASRRLLVGAVSILLPGLVLGYVGVRSFAERTNGLRTTYAATTALVRDRVLADLARLESKLAGQIGNAPPELDDSAVGQAWLRDIASAHPWLVDPFLLRIDGGIITTSL